MKKLFFVIFLFIPFIVFAESCNSSDISIISMEQKDISGGTVEVDEPNYHDRTIELNVQMFDVNDSISYDVTIKNSSDEDYMIDEDTFKTDSDYIQYSLTTDDGTNVVKANSTKGLVLGVTYKSKIDPVNFVSNTYDASNKLVLNLNTGEKEHNMDVITTDDAKNPNTNVNNVIVVIVIMFLITVAILLFDKFKINKIHSIVLLLGLLTIIPGIYAICKAEVEIESHIEIGQSKKLFTLLEDLSKEDESCVIPYDGLVTDEVGKTVQASNVYFDKCSNQRNVIFGGFCWQIIRTTETGGVKMLYNGEPVDGKCESNRGNHYGLYTLSHSTVINSTEYLYGDSFTYDFESNMFTLVNASLHSWNVTIAEDLFGKFTCKNKTGTCSKIYQINDFYGDDSSAFSLEFSMNNTVSYSHIGNSEYNSSLESPSKAGYMSNKTYSIKSMYMSSKSFKYGSSFTYDSNTNKYTLSGTTQTISDWSTGREQLDNTHYTCLNSTGVCDSIAFLIKTTSDQAKYITLKDGKDISAAVNEMLFNDDINSYDSSMKAMIDAWYYHNLNDYTDKIENTVYCNNRNVSNFGTWTVDGSLYYGPDITFISYNNSPNSLECFNLTDQFALDNNLAKLSYPIGPLRIEEINNISNSSLMESSSSWWTSSPSITGSGTGTAFAIDSNGVKKTTFLYNNIGVRPAISLNSSNIIKSGTGSETDPWIIQ